MSKLVYEEVTIINVKLDGDVVGSIKEDEEGFRYYPKGVCEKNMASDVFENLSLLKMSLEE